MKYFFIAGERSGDLHASNLIKQLKLKNPSAEIVCWGGDMMQKEGAKLLQHYSILSFMGIWEAIIRLTDVIKATNLCKNLVKSENPDVLVLVDYAGFNLRIAKWAKKNNFKIVYYISPKIWAWNTNRVHTIHKLVDKMLCILPFEKDFYKHYGYDVEYVGNPVLDAIRNFKPSADFLQRHKLENSKIIAVLPGSRKHEVENMLHYMLAILPTFPDYQFVVAGVSNLSKDYYDNFLNRTNIKLLVDETYDVLSHAQAAIVTSGTATLETALFEVPQIVVYKTSSLTYFIGKMLVKVKFISLPNLILNKSFLSELIQDEFIPHRIKQELDKIISNSTEQKKSYKELKNVLGDKNASENAAEIILNL